ncbi:MAG TPA: hypothetical protein VMS65_06700, partial [Polyangiaceae bacterium]|nr:hypothetical protein [Polyangiaceae bacterium]
LATLVFLSATGACGDTTSELITDPASEGMAGGGSSGTPECTPETAASDCTDSERRRCHPTKLTCVECTDEGQCDANEDCSDDLGECAIPCTSSDACIDEDDPVCDTLIRFCVQCVANTDCPSNQCANWECVN